jgi:S1-C subfamily serine protease
VEDPSRPRWPPPPTGPPPGGPPPPGEGEPPGQGDPFGWGQPYRGGPPRFGPTPRPPPGLPPSGGGRPWGRVVLAALLIGLLVVSAGVGTAWFVARKHQAPASSSQPATYPIRPSPQESSATAQRGQALDVQTITGKVDPAVVNVDSAIQTAATGTSAPRTGKASGTGMLVTPAGQVLTNNHVIKGATSIRVSVAGHPGGFDAKVVGADPPDDVALLQVQGLSGLPTVRLAESSRLTVGQGVVAIGNALGQGGPPAATQGTISALDRSVTAQNESGGAEQLHGLIETDAPISPGDSGGPLVNSAGQVVGMITAGTAGGRARASSVGFAIPTSSAVNVVNQIRSGKSSANVVVGEPGYLGIEARDLDERAAGQLGLDQTSGALVVGLQPGSPAEQAGISENSVITAINGRSVGSADELGQAIHGVKPGQQLAVMWSDGKGSHTARVRLTSGPAI